MKRICILLLIVFCLGLTACGSRAFQTDKAYSSTNMDNNSSLTYSKENSPRPSPSISATSKSIETPTPVKGNTTTVNSTNTNTDSSQQVISSKEALDKDYCGSYYLGSNNTVYITLNDGRTMDINTIPYNGYLYFSSFTSINRVKPDGTDFKKLFPRPESGVGMEITEIKNDIIFYKIISEDGVSKKQLNINDIWTNTYVTTITKSNVIDYNQYIKKTWFKINDNKSQGNGVSFTISNIENGKMTGELTVVGPAPSFANTVARLYGTINLDTAECQFTDSRGNKGNIILVFKPNDSMEATIKLTDKSTVNIAQPPEGTFQFEPYNLKNKKEFSTIESQSFMVNLNSWGSIKFVSGKFTGANYVPLGFYLTNNDGDILYEFNSPFTYSVDIKAVSFKDVNKDGLKDIIIIAVDDSNNNGIQIATVYFQKADGKFANDPTMDQEINSTGKNKDIETVTNYLSPKF